MSAKVRTPVELYVEDINIGLAVLVTEVEPGQAMIGWEIDDITLNDNWRLVKDRTDATNVTTRFLDPLQTIAWVGAKTPERIGKDF